MERSHIHLIWSGWGIRGRQNKNFTQGITALLLWNTLLVSGNHVLFMLLCMPGKSLSEDVQKYSYYLLIGYRYLSQVTSVKVTCYWIFNASLSPIDEFKGHSLLQAAREADLAKVKKTLALEIINFKQPQSHETALVRL